MDDLELGFAESRENDIETSLRIAEAKLVVVQELAAKTDLVVSDLLLQVINGNNGSKDGREDGADSYDTKEMFKQKLRRVDAGLELLDEWD